MTEKPEKNKTGKPREVPEDVREKQDPEYSEQDFERALEATTQRVEGSSSPAPRSPRK